MRKLIVIGGATASGKSDCAVELCRLLDGEVVSCDSMQLYRGMDIGTATPTREEQGGIVHHLLSVLSPDESCSAASYRQMALPIIEDIISRGKTPVLCGGTGLYINALTRSLGFSVKGSDEIRAQLESMDKEALHQRLSQVDPPAAQRLHPNDTRRVIRALEVYMLTGIPLTRHMEEDKKKPGDFEGLLFALDWPRETLYSRIDRRVDQMMDLGLLDEVKALKDSGSAGTALQAIGYKELIAYLDGHCTLEEAVDTIKQATRHYAKRQITWFRGDERTHWLPVQEGVSAREVARQIFDIVNTKKKREEV